MAQLELMESMLSMLGSDDGGVLFIHLFIRQLTAQVRAVLAKPLLLLQKDYLAEEAECILLATKTFTVQAGVPESQAVSSELQDMSSEPDESLLVAGITNRRCRGAAFCLF